VIAVVEETELLAAKSERAAKRTIGLAMIAGGTGHRGASKIWAIAFRHSLFAKGQAAIDIGHRYAFGKVEQEFERGNLFE
jgi:hypothetical protein